MVATKVVEGRRYSKPIGLVDAGHVYPECSSCCKKLADICITNPNLIDPRTGKPFEWKILAHCPYCGDHSFITKVYGQFIWAGYALPHPEDPEAFFPQTVIDKVVDDPKNDIINIYVVVVK